MLDDNSMVNSYIPKRLETNGGLKQGIYCGGKWDLFAPVLLIDQVMIQALLFQACKRNHFQLSSNQI